MKNHESDCLSGNASSDIASKIETQGNLVRQLKSEKKPKDEIDVAVKKLLELKVKIYFLLILH